VSDGLRAGLYKDQFNDDLLSTHHIPEPASQAGPHWEVYMFLISQSWLSASRRSDVLYGLMKSLPRPRPETAERQAG
jgi:hypothetical protein